MQILFNKTIDQCRIIGARGGRAHARNMRLRKLKAARKPTEIPAPKPETAAEANGPPGSPVPVADRRGEVRPAGTWRRPRDARSFVGSVVFIRQERGNIRPLARRAARRE